MHICAEAIFHGSWMAGTHFHVKGLLMKHLMDWLCGGGGGWRRLQPLYEGGGGFTSNMSAQTRMNVGFVERHLD